MAASDEELAALVRQYRALQTFIEARSQLAISRGTFGITDAEWLRWAKNNPAVVRQPQRGQQVLFGKPAERAMTRESREWVQLKLALDERQLSLWSEQALRTAEAAQRQTAIATTTFLQRYTEAARGVRVIPYGVPPHTVTTEALRSVPGSTVWARPVTEMRVALFEGKPVQEARRLAAQRARALLGTDTQLAHVRSAIDYVKDRGDRDNIVGYRRVPRGGQSCALCLLASTQRYHRGDLMPIHDACHCVVQPIYGDRDPGQVIEPERLNAVHARIEDATGSADLSGGHYRDAVIVHVHGEIGPVLTYREHAFTGPSDLDMSN